MNNTIDFQSTLESLGYKLIDRGKYWQTNALFRSGDNKTAIQIYKDSGVWKDYVNQSPFMSFNRLVALSLNTNDKDLIENYIVGRTTPFSLKKSEPKSVLPMEKIYNKECLTRLLPHDIFYNKKGIDSKILRMFECGLCTEGKMYQRIVFPIYNLSGKIHGFSGRYLGSSENAPKWKHIGTKTKWIYPHHLSDTYIKKHSEIIIVESIGDLLNLYQNEIFNCLCTFGVDISPSLISYILRVNPSRVILSLNNDFDKDTNVGLRGCVRNFFKLMSVLDFEKINILPPLKNDFGDMNSEDFNLWLEKKENKNFFNYDSAIKIAEDICGESNCPDSFIKKVKKFKNEYHGK